MLSPKIGSNKCLNYEWTTNFERVRRPFKLARKVIAARVLDLIKCLLNTIACTGIGIGIVMI